MGAERKGEFKLGFLLAREDKIRECDTGNVKER